MNKQISVVVLVIALVAGAFISYVSFQSQSQSNSIKIAIDLWPGFAHAYIAEEKGFFRDEGVNVELQINQNIEDNIQLFIDKKVDGLFGLQSDAMLLAAQGVQLKIVYITDFSNGGDVIISKPSIKTIQDLKGKSVSVEYLNSFNHIFLVQLLRMNGLQESDVKIVPVTGSEVPDKLEAGIIDAGQTWEPFQSEATEKGFRVLATSADEPGLITDVLIFHSKFVEERPDDVKKIIRAMDRALKYRNIDYIGSYGIMSEATGISPSDLKRTITGSIFPDLEENQQSFTKSTKTTSLYTSGKIISDFFLEKEIISTAINLRDILAIEIIMGL